MDKEEAKDGSRMEEENEMKLTVGVVKKQQETSETRLSGRPGYQNNGQVLNQVTNMESNANGTLGRVMEL